MRITIGKTCVRCKTTINTLHGGPKKDEIFRVTSVQGPFIGFLLERYLGNPETKNGMNANWPASDFEVVNEDEYKSFLVDRAKLGFSAIEHLKKEFGLSEKDGNFS